MENEIIKKCNPCQFYGFFIPVHVFNDYFEEHEKEMNTIDIDHEDLTNQKLIEYGK